MRGGIKNSDAQVAFWTWPFQATMGVWQQSSGLRPLSIPEKISEELGHDFASSLSWKDNIAVKNRWSEARYWVNINEKKPPNGGFMPKLLYSMKIKEQTRKLAAGCAEVRQGDVGVVWVIFEEYFMICWQYQQGWLEQSHAKDSLCFFCP